MAQRKEAGCSLPGGPAHVGKLMCIAPRAHPPVGLPDAQFVEDVAAKLYPSIGVMVAHAWKLGPEVAAGIGFTTIHRAPPEYQEVAMQVQVANIATFTAS